MDVRGFDFRSMAEIVGCRGPDEGYAACGSPAEVRMWNKLHHAFGRRLKQQYRCGPYRLDFFIDGVGVEVDGKKFHDFDRDKIRDEWILANCKDVSHIVRIPAAAVLYFQSAVMAAMGDLLPLRFGLWQGRADALNQMQCVRQYEAMLEDGEFWNVRAVAGMEGYAVDRRRTLAHVGNPLAFVGAICGEVWRELSDDQRRECRSPLRIIVRTRQKDLP